MALQFLFYMSIGYCSGVSVNLKIIKRRICTVVENEQATLVSLPDPVFVEPGILCRFLRIFKNLKMIMSDFYYIIFSLNFLKLAFLVFLTYLYRTCFMLDASPKFHFHS